MLGRRAVLRRPRAATTRTPTDAAVRLLRRPGAAGDAAVEPGRRAARQAARATWSPRSRSTVGDARAGGGAAAAAVGVYLIIARDRLRLRRPAAVRPGHAARLHRLRHRPHRQAPGGRVHRAVDGGGDARPGARARHLRRRAPALRVRLHHRGRGGRADATAEAGVLLGFTVVPGLSWASRWCCCAATTSAATRPSPRSPNRCPRRLRPGSSTSCAEDLRGGCTPHVRAAGSAVRPAALRGQDVNAALRRGGAAGAGGPARRRRTS